MGDSIKPIASSIFFLKTPPREIAFSAMSNSSGDGLMGKRNTFTTGFTLLKMTRFFETAATSWTMFHVTDSI
jgi:hypothetical protein